MISHLLFQELLVLQFDEDDGDNDGYHDDDDDG